MVIGWCGVVARSVERHTSVVQRLDVQLARDRLEVRPRQGNPPAHLASIAQAVGKSATWMDEGLMLFAGLIAY